MALSQFETDYLASVNTFKTDWNNSDQSKATFDRLNQEHHDRLEVASKPLTAPSDPPGHPIRPL